MSLDSIIDGMNWSEWRRMPLKSGPAKDLRSCDDPGPEFWVLWREFKADLKAIGIHVFNRDGSGWRVEQWVPAGTRPRLRRAAPARIYAKRESARPSFAPRSERTEYWKREIRRAPR